MESRKTRQWTALLCKKLQRAYRYSVWRRLQLWLRGRTLHWSIYLASAILLAGALLGLHHYFSQQFYVVSLGGREVGMVRDGEEIEEFISELSDCCSSFYGMVVEPAQKISLTREYRAGAAEDVAAVKDALRQQIKLITEAVLLTVDCVPAVPVISEEEVAAVIDLLGDVYTDRSDGSRLLEVSLLEEVAGMPCSVSPETVCTAEEAAALLLGGEIPHEKRLQLASRHGESMRGGGDAEPEQPLPKVHVQTVEEVKIVESIPYSTSYTYNDKLWYVKSHVLKAGKEGVKEVTYHVTCENGKEIGREAVGQRVMREPVTQVIEKGTSQVPALGSGRFTWPVAGGGVISQYYSSRHRAIDICSLGKNVPILAADSGVVVEAGSRYPLGNYIVIYHGSYYTVYNHNHVNYVSKGAKVSRGQTIALMGNTGRTRGRTGIHLHFEIRRCSGDWSRSPALNPLSFF